jgi:hypothetical protein
VRNILLTYISGTHTTSHSSYGVSQTTGRCCIDVKESRAVEVIMKRICVSAGLLALGAAVSQAQYAPGLSPLETSKSWALTATIRGFYDDNYLTLPKTIPGPNGTVIQGARGSFGVEASPSISYNHSVSDTLLSATYVYDVRWYQDRFGTTDQTHQFNAKMEHEFSERYKLTLNETFVVAQEPGVLDPGAVSTPLRVPGSNMRNTAAADFTAQMTKSLDLHVGYANTYYAFQENAGDEYPANAYPSYSALLDRMDQTATVDLRWKALPESTAVIGYSFDAINYTSPEDVIFAPGPINTPASLDGPGHAVASIRNQQDHFGFVGVDQSFSPNLNGSIRVGGELEDYYNFGTYSITPYLDASVTWQYQPQCTAQMGVKYQNNSTDVAGTVGTTPVLDEQSTTAYLAISHQVSSRFSIAFLGQAQYSTFNGGGILYDGEEEDFYMLNLNLAYHFNPWLTGETGYVYNRLVSQLLDRSYIRNQVYIGVRATY